MRIFVIGHRTGPTTLGITSNAEIDAVADRMQSNRTFWVRCGSPDDLVRIMAEAGSEQRIDRLDIYDHAAPGIQALGSALLFASNADPASPLGGDAVARKIAPYLSETAQVRLLGCNTALGPAGRLLLLKLARALGGHRVVFGTNHTIIDDDFDADGFSAVMEPQRLFSSQAALDGEAPDAARRLENRLAIKAAL